MRSKLEALRARQVDGERTMIKRCVAAPADLLPFSIGSALGLEKLQRRIRWSCAGERDTTLKRMDAI